MDVIRNTVMSDASHATNPTTNPTISVFGEAGTVATVRTLHD
jgi:hypothetical protein